MQIVTSLLSILIYVLLIIFVFDGNSLVYWMQLIYLASALFDVSWFLWYGKVPFNYYISLISRMLIIIFVFAFVHSKEDLLVYTGIMAVSFLIEQVQLLPFLHRYVNKVSIKKKMF